MTSVGRGRRNRVTYGVLQRQGDRWILADVAPHVAIRLKAIFQGIPKTQTGTFDLPFTDEMCANLHWFVDRYAMRMSVEDREALVNGRERFEDDLAEMDAILLPDWKPPSRYGFKPGYALYQSQAQAVEILQRRKSLLLGDDVGLGKSFVAMGAIAGSQYLPAAVVVQAHLPSQWMNEFIKPATYLKAHVIEGTKPYNLPPANLYIFRYTNIHGWVDIAATGLFKQVFYDEVQELRHGLETQKGKAAKVFSENAVIRCALSATPIFNYGDEIFNIVEFLEPGLLGAREEFYREWCSYIGGGKYKVTDPDALGTYLRETGLFLRRLRQGRKINTIAIEVDYDEEVAEKSEDLARQLAIKVVRGSFAESGQAARELDAFARHQTGLAKAHGVAAQVRMLLEAGIPVLLAGWHRSVYDIWMKELAEFNPLLYTGSENAKKKDKTKQAFINGETNLVIISLRSGAGLDGLQKRCSTVVIGELDWTGAVYEQLFGRVDRPGQKADEITAIYLYCNYGSDPTMMRVNAIKRDQARGINDPGLGPQPVYSDESRIKMLAKQFLEKRGIAA